MNLTEMQKDSEEMEITDTTGAIINILALATPALRRASSHYVSTELLSINQ